MQSWKLWQAELFKLLMILIDMSGALFLMPPSHFKMWLNQHRIPLGGYATENFLNGMKRLSYTAPLLLDVQLLAVLSVLKNHL